MARGPLPPAPLEGEGRGEGPFLHLSRSSRERSRPAAGAGSAEQNRNQHHPQTVLPSHKRNQDAGITVARHQGFIGAALHRGDLCHARQARRRPAEEQTTG